MRLYIKIWLTSKLLFSVRDVCSDDTVMYRLEPMCISWGRERGVSEWSSEWVSEWVIKWVGEWVSGWVSEWSSEWVSEWVGEWSSEWVSEWVSGWVSGWVSEWVSEWVKWVSEWVSEWERKWVRECVGEWVRGVRCANQQPIPESCLRRELLCGNFYPDLWHSVSPPTRPLSASTKQSI